MEQSEADEKYYGTDNETRNEQISKSNVILNKVPILRLR